MSFAITCSIFHTNTVTHHVRVDVRKDVPLRGTLASGLGFHARARAELCVRIVQWWCDFAISCL